MAEKHDEGARQAHIREQKKREERFDIVDEGAEARPRRIPAGESPTGRSAAQVREDDARVIAERRDANRPVQGPARKLPFTGIPMTEEQADADAERARGSRTDVGTGAPGSRSRTGIFTGSTRIERAEPGMSNKKRKKRERNRARDARLIAQGRTTNASGSPRTSRSRTEQAAMDNANLDITLRDSRRAGQAEDRRIRGLGRQAEQAGVTVSDVEGRQADESARRGQDSTRALLDAMNGTGQHVRDEVVNPAGRREELHALSQGLGVHPDHIVSYVKHAFPGEHPDTAITTLYGMHGKRSTLRGTRGGPLAWDVIADQIREHSQTVANVDADAHAQSGRQSRRAVTANKEHADALVAFDAASAAHEAKVAAGLAKPEEAPVRPVHPLQEAREAGTVRTGVERKRIANPNAGKNGGRAPRSRPSATFERIPVANGPVPEKPKPNNPRAPRAAAPAAPAGDTGGNPTWVPPTPDEARKKASKSTPAPRGRRG